MKFIEFISLFCWAEDDLFSFDTVVSQNNMGDWKY